MINFYLWQNATWLFFHKLSINQDMSKNSHYEKFFESFKILIPCSICRNHYNQMLNEKKFNLKNNIKNNNLFHLTVDMHNNVNTRTNKLIWDYQKARNHYNSFYLNFKDIKKFILIFVNFNYGKGPDKTQNLIKMIKSFTHIFPKYNCRQKLIEFQKTKELNKKNLIQWVTAYLLIIRYEM